MTLGRTGQGARIRATATIRRLSFSFSRILDPVYASPFTVPPSPDLIDAAKALSLPPDFSGRAGLLLCRSAKSGQDKCLTAAAPVDPGLPNTWSTLSPSQLWPTLAADALPDASIMNGRGEEIGIKALIDTIFADYPDRPADQGRESIERKKGEWRHAILKGLESPTVRVLDAFNRLRRAEPREDWTLVGTAEWWVGRPEAHDVKHAGTFISPQKSVKYLIDALLVGIPHEDARPIVTAAPEVPVLYEDEAIVVIDKPARLSSVPGVRETISAKSVLEATRGALRVVHRLDVDTSGLLVFAKTSEAEKALHAAFREGLALKRYVARLEGVPQKTAGTVTLPIAVNLLDRPRQCILSEAAGGKASLTDWELLRVDTMPDGTRKAIVNLWPETGRTHQLRIHCAHRDGLGMPIDGDSFYGSMGILAEAGTTRLCLHAAMLTFPHPTTGEVMSFEREAVFPLF